MRHYLFIQDPGSSELRRISPGEVPALFCLREETTAPPPRRFARLRAAFALAQVRAQTLPATFGAALARSLRASSVDPAGVPR